jgi:putative ABC transport system permease protein
MFVRAERSVDTFHQSADRLRAVWVDLNWNLGSEPSLGTQIPLAAALEEHAAVERAAVKGWAGVQGVRVPGREGVFQAQVHFASDGYLDLFAFPLLRGDRDRVLSEPGIVLSEQTARRLFGDGDAVGQALTLERWRDTLNVTVTGILAEPEGRSTLDAEALLSLASLPEDDRGGWYMSGPNTFLRLAPGRTDADLAPAFANIVGEHFAEAETPPEYGVVPVADLHLDALSPADGFRGDAGFLRLFSLVAGFALLLGVINYVNLATARATRRAREVGVRKAVGAGRGRIAAQFLTESVALAVISGVVAVALAALLRPGFNALFGADLGAGDLDGPFALAALALAVGTGLVAGVYPAFVLSGFRPVTALRGTTGSGRGAGRLRQALVVVQLVVAVGLLSGTGVVLRQLAYAQSQDPGYDAGGLVVVDLNGPRLTPQWRAAANAVRALPEVEAAAATHGYPTNANMFYGGDIGGDLPVEEYKFRTVEGEPGYLRTLGARPVAGRLLDDREGDRTRSVVLNEAAVRDLGLTPADAVGRQFTFNEGEHTVVGVVEDQHLTSFREPVDPMWVKVAQPWQGEALTYGSLLVRLRPGQLAAGVDGVRAALLDLGAEADPEVEFLDEAVAGLYESERRLGGVLGAFAGVAILIACLGLFGLAAYTAERRTKEIGIRRVLGATVGQVVGLLTREYVALVALAAALAVPAAVLVMRRWLEGFAYHAALDPGLFVLAVALALAFALLAVGGQALRAATADPARALRAE